MISGDQIKKAIKTAGITLEEARGRLGISRQTLYINLSKAVAEKKFIESLKEKLREVDLEIFEGSTNDFVNKNEPAMVADALKDQLIKSQQQTIEALNSRIESLLNDIQRLTNQTDVQQQASTGRRRSA